MFYSRHCYSLTGWDSQVFFLSCFWHCRADLTCPPSMSLKSWPPQSKTEWEQAKWTPRGLRMRRGASPFMSPLLAREAELRGRTSFLHRGSCILHPEVTMEIKWVFGEGGGRPCKDTLSDKQCIRWTFDAHQLASQTAAGTFSGEARVLYPTPETNSS